MAARTRTQNFAIPRGTAYNESRTVVLGGGNCTNTTNTCNDQTGAGDNQALSISKYTYEGYRMNRDGSTHVTTFENFVPDGLMAHGNFPHGPNVGLLTDMAYAAKAMARTNPSRPYVDVPVAALELRELVPLIRDLGRDIIRRSFSTRRTQFRGNAIQVAGSTNLAYQFGIRPLVGDIVKLCNYQEQVQRRLKEIDRLAGPKGLRRTLEMDSCSTSGRTNKVLQSNLQFLTADIDWMTQTDVRAHVRWRAEKVLHRLARNPGHMEALARRAVLGLTVDLSTAWEAMPWTWLADYVGTVGDYLKASRNIIPAVMTSLSITRHSTTTYTYPGKPFGNNGHIDAGKNVRKNILRSVVSAVAPTAHFPFLSGNQVGILASLSVARRR